MNITTRSKMTGSRKAWGSMVIALTIAFLAGCGEQKPVPEPEAKDNVATEKDTAAIEAVILKEFSGPDEAYREFMNEAMEAQSGISDQAEFDIYKESPVYQKFLGYMELTYAPYFTENGYQNFINAAPAFMYHGWEGNYTMSVSDITFSQNENNRTLYNFSFPVTLTDALGKTEIFEFEGKAIVPNPGKIGSIEFKDRNNLQSVLNALDYGALPFHTATPSLVKIGKDEKQMPFDSSYEEVCWVKDCDGALPSTYHDVHAGDAEIGDKLLVEWTTMEPKPSHIYLVHFDENGEVSGEETVKTENLLIPVDEEKIGKRYGVRFLWKDGETLIGHGMLNFNMQ